MWCTVSRLIRQLACAVIACSAGAEAAPVTILEWLRSETPQKQSTPFYVELGTASAAEHAMLVMSPDDQHFAFLHRGSQGSFIRVGQMRSTVVPLTKPSIRWSNYWEKPVAAHDVRWSPDGDRLFAELGSPDALTTGWFSIDATTGESTADRHMLLKLLQSDAKPGRRRDTGPVWSLGGKEFSSAAEAKAAGINRFAVPSPRDRADCNFTLFGEQHETFYNVLILPANPIWKAFVIHNDAFIEQLRLAGPVHQKVMFQTIGTHLHLKLCWHAFRLPRQAHKRNPDSFHAITVDLGEWRLDDVGSAGKDRILVHLAGISGRAWRVLDIEQICFQNSRLEGQLFIER